MPKKPQTVFVCKECGFESPKWLGQCECGAWNSFYEQKILPESGGAGGVDSRSRTVAKNVSSGKHKGAVLLSDVVSSEKDRLVTGIDELDTVLGGGIVKGSLSLITGEPGIGKSTLILQTAIEISLKYGDVLYVSGEESEEQVKMRADRLAEALPSQVLPEHLFIYSQTNIENISLTVENMKPVFLIIDSIQTMYTDTLDQTSGNISQVRACTNELMRVAKVLDIPIFIVAHVTKSGDIAGPKIIEHLVDCVLTLNGERDHDLRILRSTKNRFGATNEIGAFEMKEDGLQEVHDLSGVLLEDMSARPEGAVITATSEGNRPLLLEIQALTAKTGPGFAGRSTVGVDKARLNMIIAVLERKAHIDLSERDIYVNVVGGIKPDSTSVDLAVAFCIYSSTKGIAITGRTLVCGEIGLTGEIRGIKSARKIANEAAKLGFERIILPKKNAAQLGDVSGLKVIGVSNISEALEIF
jgi:DNA repair protein RadA/Sms